MFDGDLENHRLAGIDAIDQAKQLALQYMKRVVQDAGAGMPRPTHAVV